MRMPIGPYLPDFLLIGLSARGYSLIAIEINGGCYINKLEKDFAKEDRLHELGILSLPIQTPQATDLEFLRKLFKDSKLINICDRQDQIDNVLRRIMVKTIVNFWTLGRIEYELKSISSKDYHLKKELFELAKRPDCPRAIKKEFGLIRASR